MDRKQALREYFAAHQAEIRKEIIDLTLEVVRQKTVNVVPDKLAEHPYLKIRGEEWRVAEIVTRELTKAGIRFTSHSRQEGRPNVIARVGRNASGQRLLVPGHMDVVPAGDEAKWTVCKPFDPIEKDGTLYGRGVIDDKGPMVSALVAAKVLKAALGDEGLAGEFQFAALSDEESTGPDGVDYGAEYLLEEKLLDATCAIIPDVGEEMRAIDIAEKGGGVIRVVAQGVPAHGSTPEKGVNAVHKMAKLLMSLEKFPFVFTPHPILGGPSINVGEIFGGAAPNIVPDRCTISIDFRLVPGQTMQQVRDQVAGLAAAIAPDFEVSIAASRLPHAVDADNPLVHAIQANSPPVLGFTPQPIGIGGTTYAKWFNLGGIPSVGWGPGDDNAFHVANEYVSVEQLVQFALLLTLVAVDLVG
jgi:acetylornithine deacetylase/succinyl-diaminopimelate desuccinylase family protein